MSNEEYFPKKPMTIKQATVMRIVRAGGHLIEQYGKPGRYRLLDVKKNPLSIIQQRTFKALRNSDRIIRKESIWIANPIKRIKNVTAAYRELNKDFPQ